MSIPLFRNYLSWPKLSLKLTWRTRAVELSVTLYRCAWVASKESNLKPRRDEDPCCVEAGELWKVRPDITWGPVQDGGLSTLSVENFPCSTVVHISPERCHNPPVPGDRKSHRCELRHLPQERYQAIVVDLRRSKLELEYLNKTDHTLIHFVQHVRVTVTCL